MRFSLTVLWCAVAISTWGQSKPDPAAAARGRTQFKSSCGFCHGDDATGNRGPDLLRSAALSHDQAGETLTPLIRNGRPDKGMPGFPALTAPQVSNIVAFLHSRALEALHSNNVSNDYPLEKLLTGNAEAGRKYFDGAGGCAGCHSVWGDLRGIASKYRPIELQQRFLYPSRAGSRTATVTTAGGQVFEGKVTHADEFEIAITAKDGWYRSWDRSAVKVEIRDPLAAHRAMMPKYTDADVHNLFAYLETLK